MHIEILVCYKYARVYEAARLIRAFGVTAYSCMRVCAVEICNKWGLTLVQELFSLCELWGDFPIPGELLVVTFLESSRVESERVTSRGTS